MEAQSCGASGDIVVVVIINNDNNNNYPADWLIWETKIKSAQIEKN